MAIAFGMDALFIVLFIVPTTVTVFLDLEDSNTLYFKFDLVTISPTFTPLEEELLPEPLLPELLLLELLPELLLPELLLLVCCTTDI